MRSYIFSYPQILKLFESMDGVILYIYHQSQVKSRTELVVIINIYGWFR